LDAWRNSVQSPETDENTRCQDDEDQYFEYVILVE